MSCGRRIVFLGILPILTLAVGWQLGLSAQQAPDAALNGSFAPIPSGSGAVQGDPEQEVNIDVLWGVWRLLQSHYIDPGALDARAMVLGAVRGLVAGIGDPYTAFMAPEENQEFRDGLSGHLEGIGAELSLESERVIIVAPLKGSPAETAGLQPRDEILAVDDEDTAGQSLQTVVSKIRGPKGTTVSLTILREGEQDVLTVTITREDITVPSTEYEVRTATGGSVGVLSINQFGDETVPEVRTILRGLQQNPPDALIIDLRYNGGGYLDGAVDLSSMFLTGGTVVHVEGREETVTHNASGRPLLPSIPLAVLVNEGSASASEIVAGALQDHGRAVIVGMQTFGKGTVQEVFELPGGSSMRVTIARWKTPDGRIIEKDGITPDVVIDRTREDAEAERDPQMEEALRAVLGIGY